MRALFLGLILVNILYWTWAYSVDKPEESFAQALDPDLPRLELVPRKTPLIDHGAAPTEMTATETAEPAVEVPLVGSDAVLTVADSQVGGADDVVAEEAVPEQELVANTGQAAVPEVPPEIQNLLAAADPVSHPARCISVGPFVSLRQASEAAALLNQAGLTTSQRAEESQVWVGHWVHLPSYPSRAAAVEVVEELRKQGIKDIYIEPSGELKNTISLGLFTELERAEVRAGRVRQLSDVSPQIRNRSRDGLVYWIDAAIEAGISVDTASLPHNSSQELRTEIVECEAESA